MRRVIKDQEQVSGWRRVAFLGARGDDDTQGALDLYPTGNGELWEFILQQKDLTRSIFHGKPLPHLTCREMLGKAFKHTPGFLGTPAGITTKSQPFRQSGNCSGPR